VPEGNRRKSENFLNMAAEAGGHSGKGGAVHGLRSPWISPTPRRVLSISGGRAAAGSGVSPLGYISSARRAGGFLTNGAPTRDGSDEVGGRGETRPRGRTEDTRVSVRPPGMPKRRVGREAQLRIVREVWKRVVVPLDYSRPVI